MDTGFWQKLKRPFFALAPMADVTDAAFRRVIAKYGKPDVMWTEFVSADGLCSPGREVLLRDLLYTEAERPIVAQIFGSKPANIEKVSRMIKELGFDGIDINMGCPDKSIEKQGAGAAMMKTPELAIEAIAAAKEGAGGLPVSVKTRVGFNRVELDTWLPKLLSAKPAAITVHARTRKELSLVPARWEHVSAAVIMAKGTGTLIIGNGDVKNIVDAKIKSKTTGADGIMLGRAIFGDPWLFANPAHTATPTLEQKLSVMVEHTRLFQELLGDVKSFAIMKKHYKAYVNGFVGAKDLRVQLMDASDPDDVARIVDAFLAEVPSSS